MEKSRTVNEHFFPGVGKPTLENILKGYLNIFSDVNFNAVGSVTARKLAEKVTLIYTIFLSFQSKNKDSTLIQKWPKMF